jgi:hypothetical protein
MMISRLLPLVSCVALSMLAADRASTSSYASVKPVLDQPSDLLPAELVNANEANVKQSGGPGANGRTKLFEPVFSRAIWTPW